jgi:3-hydroxyisobutyrate dehydrogenase-like beta-hydroxyacid dehydrogenase
MQVKPRKTLGLVGLGLVGAALSQRFTAAGFEVFGYDLDSQKNCGPAGFTGCSSPAEVAARSCRLVLSLPTSAVVEEVVGQVRGHLHSGYLIVDTTTADPQISAKLGTDLAGAGIGFVDATILGSSQEVDQGEALVLAGGSEADFLACGDICAAFAKQVFHLGICGAGASTKLVVNLVLGLQRLVLAEGMVLGEKAGIDPSQLLKILRAGAAYARVMDTKGDKMAAGEYSAQARLGQHLKDVDLILDLGQQTATPLPLSALHAQILRAGVAQGLGELDNAAVVEVLRRLAGGGHA